jgi:hypothetical protein
VGITRPGGEIRTRPRPAPLRPLGWPTGWLAYWRKCAAFPMPASMGHAGSWPLTLRPACPALPPALHAAVPSGSAFQQPAPPPQSAGQDSALSAPTKERQRSALLRKYSTPQRLSVASCVSRGRSPIMHSFPEQSLAIPLIELFRRFAFGVIVCLRQL